MKERLEKDLSANEAKISSSKNIDATSFAIEYTIGDTSGQIKISGTRGPGNYYSLSSELDEKTGGNQ